jgi:hypothetical protein
VRRRLPARASSAAAVASLLLACASCAARRPGPVDFSDSQRTYQPKDYDRVRNSWTRHSALVVLDVGTVLDTWAVCKSWDFRQAYIEQYAETYGITDHDREELRRSELEASRAMYEFHVTAESTNYKWNDLQSKDSPWKVTLVDGTGAEVAPSSLEVVKYPELYEMRFFPTRTDFSRTYVIKFPKAATEPDARPFAGMASGRITLRLAGPLGRSELTWDAL